MFKNYFKTAIRNIKRNRKHAILNILGLGVALAACIVVFLVIQFENSHDKHLQNYNNIYQVVTKDIDSDGEHYTGGVPFPTIKFLRQDFPQYQFAELMQNYGVQVTVRGDGNNHTAYKKFREESGVFYGDPPLLELFEVKFLAGDHNVLKDVNNVALSKSLAEKYFGNWQDAMGKRINIDNAPYDFQVASVFEDVPAESDFPFNLVASYAGFIAHGGNEWPLDDWGANTSNHQVFVLLPKGTNTATFDGQLAVFEKKYNTENKRSTRTHFLHPLQNIHFDERFFSNGDHFTSKTSLYTLSFIGVLIILMACINFVNLSTALAITRSKEIGIRKVMGSSKTQVSTQVLFETAIIVLLSVFVAVALAWQALPFIKNIMVVQSKLDIFNPGNGLFIVLITIVTILLSGIYPAFIMARFNPVEAIKSKISTTKVGGVSLRRVLVVLQFAFSQILIIATIIAISQMDFIKKADLGFNKEALLVVGINTDSATSARQEAFKAALLARNDVKQVSFGFDAPSSDNSWQSNFAFDVMEDRDFNVQLKYGDQQYASTYGLELVAGKFYGASDTIRDFVVNETLLKKVGVKNPQDAIGKMVRLGGQPPRPVIGVVKDFKQQSLREAVVPIVMMPRKKYYQTAGIKLSGTNLGSSNAAIKKIWDDYFPEYVYNASFLDENINRFYEQEERLSNMYKVYALLAIFISCLGLYGLVSFMVVQKTKEVGIRKVLGASIQNILYLFSREFTILIAIAFVLAVPAAWYLMNTWLKNFEYRIDIGAGVFIGAMAISMVIAWVTVGYKAIRAAMANPVKSLRME